MSYSADGYSGDLAFNLGEDGYFRFHFAPVAKSRTSVITGKQVGYYYSFIHYILYGDVWAPFEENADFSWSQLPKVKK
ncbi:MAG: hypothetical protein QM755_17355 [Luteolibacter sp.]